MQMAKCRSCSGHREAGTKEQSERVESEREDEPSWSGARFAFYSTARGELPKQGDL